MKVRQFGLKNAKSTGSEMYDLMDIRHYFNEPNGLGWGIDATVKRLGQTFVATEENTKQPGPKGEMWFATYELYEEFLRFCQVGGLVLCYKPSEQIPWRYLDCSIVIEKSEIDHEHGYLNCGVTFTGQSRWYEDPIISHGEAEEPAETKRYYQIGGEEIPYAYQYAYHEDISDPYHYVYGISDVSLRISGVVVPSYFELTIFGPCLNPTYMLFSNGKEIHRGQINTGITSNQKLVINTHPKKMEISKYTKSGKYVENAYGQSNFETERIFTVPSGDSYMTVISDSYDQPTITIEVMKVV